MWKLNPRDAMPMSVCWIGELKISISKMVDAFHQGKYKFYKHFSVWLIWYTFFCNSTIVHEFVHALGAFHVHSRDDRDNYVTVDFSNIQSGKEHNFQKHANAPTFGAPYDPMSLMHYEHWSFAVDTSKSTIYSKVIVTFPSNNLISFQSRTQPFTQ